MQTTSSIVADFDRAQAVARDNKNRRIRSAHNGRMVGLMLTHYSKLAVGAGLLGSLVAIVWGLS